MSKESQPQELDSGIVIGEDGLARPKWASVDPMLREYYDTEWGMPIRDEQGLYERLSLEAFQAGLSWATFSGSKSAKAVRKAGRLRKMVAHDSPAWKASKLKRS